MDTKLVSLEGFYVVGYRLEINLEEFGSGIGKETYEKLLSRQNDVSNKEGVRTFLIQIYPQKEGFNPWSDRFEQIFGYEVTAVENVPEDMISYYMAKSSYVNGTHEGLEEEMQRSYDYLYGTWMQENKKMPKGIDFEIWDERYKPDSPDNVIDLYIAINE